MMQPENRTAPGDVGAERALRERITAPARWNTGNTREQNLERIAELGQEIAGALLEDLKLGAEAMRALELGHGSELDAIDRFRDRLRRRHLL